MKPIDVKSDSYVEYNVDSNNKDPLEFRSIKTFLKKDVLLIGEKKFLL